jgi:GNAT superfamily N-acetyltransferase
VDLSIFEPLGSKHDRAAFSCGAEPLDRYLRRQASQDVRNHVAAVFVLCPRGSSRIIGYYTLSAFAILLKELPEDLTKHFPKYPQVPTVLLGRLAVDQQHAGQGWGKVLLLDALRRGLEQASQIAAMAIVADAKDDAARTFYEHYGFQTLGQSEDRLFLPMKTIAQLF